MKTQSKRKALTLAVCAMLLVVATVFGTLAYLTDIQKAVNTFTVGNVDVDFDESNPEDPTGERVTENEYHLVPGSTYTKDPTFHVAANSEDTYLFVEITDDIAPIEAEATVATQLANNGWVKVRDVEGKANTALYVYANADGTPKAVEKSEEVQDIVVFEEFTIKDDVTNEELQAYAGKTITLTAYAVQASGFEGKPATEVFDAAFPKAAETTSSTVAE